MVTLLPFPIRLLLFLCDLAGMIWVLIIGGGVIRLMVLFLSAMPFHGPQPTRLRPCQS